MKKLAVFLPIFVLLGCGCGGGGGSSSLPPAQSPGSSAVNDAVSVDEDSMVAISVTANDRDVDASTIEVSSAPANGSVAIESNEIVYTPDSDFSGDDSFRYSVTGNDGVVRTATVSVAVSEINDSPIARDDQYVLVEDNELLLSLLDNDSDVDDGIVEYQIEFSDVGSISGSGVALVYTPPLDFVGEVSFMYRAVDASGAVSETASVSINVVAVTATSLEVFDLFIPETGYASGNDAELNASVLASERLSFTVPPNAISVLMTLNGADANVNDGGLFISSIEGPGGMFPIYQRNVHFCFGGNCSGLVPRLPEYMVESGEWQYQLGTLDTTTQNIDFSSLTLTATIRTGPTPDLELDRPAAFRVQIFSSATSISLSEVEASVDELVRIAEQSQMEFVAEPVVLLADESLEIVSSSFLDSETSAMVEMGDPDTLNVFLVEDFSDTEGLAGISGGIPGHLGVRNGSNGVLLRATSFISGDSVFVDSLAETAFHEIGHLLGLYHTTEGKFSFVDVLADTPECVEEIHDTNNNGAADSSECPDAANPMFWRTSVLIDPEPLSADQKRVLFNSPLAVPGSQ